LLWAAEKGHLQVVKLLIKHDTVNVNVLDSKGRIPLCLAVEKEHKEIIQLLVANDKVDVTAWDKPDKH